jgi:putative transcriptional regulator
MRFEWDEAKSRQCLRERGFSFAFVISAFADPKRQVEIESDGRMARCAIACTAGSAAGCSSSCTRSAVASFESFLRARPMHANGDVMVTRARLKGDGTVAEIRRDGSERPLVPEVDWAKIDATTEEQIAAQIAADEAEARRDAAAWARRVRRKVGLSQIAFARRIGVPVDTLRNWEQGKRVPRGPARALLQIIDRAPEAALHALDGTA